MKKLMFTHQDQQSFNQWLQKVFGMFVSILVVFLMVKATGGLNHEPMPDYSINSIDQTINLNDQGLIRVQEVVDLDIREKAKINYAIQLNDLDLTDLQVSYLADGQKGETTEAEFFNLEIEDGNQAIQGHPLTLGQEVGPDTYTLTVKEGRALVKFQPDFQADNHYLYLDYFLTGGLTGHQDVALLDWQLLGNSIVSIGRYQASLQLPQSAASASQAWLTKDKEVFPLTIDSQARIDLPVFGHSSSKIVDLQILLPLTSFKHLQPADQPLSLSQLQNQIQDKSQKLTETNKKHRFFKILLVSLLFPLPFIKITWDFLSYRKAYQANLPIRVIQKTNQSDLPEQIKPGQVLGKYYNFVNQPGASLISATLLDLLVKGYLNLFYLPAKKTWTSRKGDSLVLTFSSKDPSQLSKFEILLLKSFQSENHDTMNFQTMIQSLPKQSSFRLFQKDNLANLNRLKQIEFLPSGHRVIDTNGRLHRTLMFTVICWITASGLAATIFTPLIFTLVLNIIIMAGLIFYIRAYYNKHPLLPAESYQAFQDWQTWASHLKHRDLAQFKLEDLAYAAIFGRADQVLRVHQKGGLDLGSLQVLIDHDLSIQDFIEIVDSFFSRVKDIRPDGTYPSS